MTGGVSTNPPGAAMLPDYGRSFARWRAACPEQWQAYTQHGFVEALGDGSLAPAAFVTYLRQDYLYLIHYSRAWALAVVKAGSLAELQACSAMVQALLHLEMPLHLQICAEAGIDQAEILATQEAFETLAYTRYVMDAGQAGDFLDLMAALAPCVFGYGEIGARLLHQTQVAGVTGPYQPWIETYGGAQYQALCLEVGALIDRAVAERLGDDAQSLPRWQGLQHHFTTATRLEAAFWGVARA